MKNDRSEQRRQTIQRMFTAGLLLTLSFSGCRHTAAIGVLLPSSSIVSGHGRVALVGVANDEAGLLTAQLDERLGEFAHWSVVDPAEIAPIQLASADESPNIETIIENAAAANVELLVSAEVEEALVLPPPRWNPLANQSTAKMTVQLAAFSPTSQDARETKTITTTLALPRDTTTIPADSYRRMTAMAIDEFLRDFQPKNSSVRINLATMPIGSSGSRLVRIGNLQAHQGRWSMATTYWERALESNPDNDAALFNLAVAAMTDRRFDEAEELALKALRLRPDPIYIAGFDSIKTLAEKDRDVRFQTGEQPVE